MPVRQKTLPERQLRDVADLTDNTGETADTTIAKVDTVVTGVDGTGNNAAAKADVDARLDLINKNFADLTTTVNSILAAKRNKP